MCASCVRSRCPSIASPRRILYPSDFTLAFALRRYKTGGRPASPNVRSRAASLRYNQIELTRSGRYLKRLPAISSSSLSGACEVSRSTRVSSSRAFALRVYRNARKRASSRLFASDIATRVSLESENLLTTYFIRDRIPRISVPLESYKRRDSVRFQTVSLAIARESRFRGVSLFLPR